jgi:hypothetical protein
LCFVNFFLFPNMDACFACEINLFLTLSNGLPVNSFTKLRN